MIKRIPYALLQWAVSAAVYFSLTLVGLPAVALGLAGDGAKRTPAMWRLWGSVEDIPLWWYTAKGESRFQKWWWMAIRNPVRGLDKYLPQADHVVEYANGDVENAPGFRWRYRHTKWRDSLRITWGELRPFKGKKEFYIGYKIGPDVDNTSFTIQLRPF